ncbi:MAG: hypothetical protein AAFX86_04260 [Pseudomonadota bacterium]
MASVRDMNGLWSGWYTYSTLSEPVPFTAWIDDSAGLLTGSILEPNTFSAMDIDDLQAELAGTRLEQQIHFSKTYAAGQGAHEKPIIYEGRADEDFITVRGQWSFANPRDGKGPFELSRSSKSISEGILRDVFAFADR